LLTEDNKKSGIPTLDGGGRLWDRHFAHQTLEGGLDSLRKEQKLGICLYPISIACQFPPSGGGRAMGSDRRESRVHGNVIHTKRDIDSDAPENGQVPSIISLNPTPIFSQEGERECSSNAAPKKNARRSNTTESGQRPTTHSPR